MDHILCVHSFWQFINMLDIESPCDPAVPFLGVQLQRKGTTVNPYTYSYTARYENVYRSILHCSQKVETTRVSIYLLIFEVKVHIFYIQILFGYDLHTCFSHSLGYLFTFLMVF